MQIKRLLFLLHRWLGVALAVFMFGWFLSGLVIVYAPVTNQSRSDQLARAEILSPAAGWLGPVEAWVRSGAASPASAAAPSAIAEARLLRQAGEPVWLIEDTGGQTHALSAETGAPVEVSAERALEIARGWLDPGATPRYLERFEHDATMRNRESLRPFHRIAADDAAGTELTISARSGEVLRVATRVDRGLFWIGNWLHLFRPLESLGWGEARRDVLLWVSGATLLATLTGLIVGWLRWKPGWGGRPTYGGDRVHPYRAFWFRWHFWGGLVGGIAALLWIGSGFLNNNPWQAFSPAATSRAELARYLGAAVPPALQDWRPGPLPAAAADAVELRWRRLGDDAVLLAFGRDGNTIPLSGEGFGQTALLAAVARATNDAPVARHELITAYDSYYYLRHGRSSVDRPLPALRVDLADTAGTRFYLDPQEGRLLLKQDRSRRVYRWLFSALHHWDFGWLYARPLWDGWMLLWIGFGLTMSATALVLAWKRLAVTFGRRRAPAPAKPVPAKARLAASGQRA